MSADSPIEALCAAHGWTVIEILRVHERNRVATVRVRPHSGPDLLLKCLLSGAPAESAAALAREREVYASESIPLVPRLVSGDAVHFSREYEDGVSLRRWVIDNERGLAQALPQHVARVLDALAASRSAATADWRASDAVSRACDRFKNLLTSGPAGTSRPLAAARVSSLIAGRFTKSLRWILEGMVARWLDEGALVASRLTHNDLHLDNVLITARGPRIVDFGSVSRPGAWWVDALYLLATCYAASGSGEVRAALLRSFELSIAHSEPKLVGDLVALAVVFSGAAASNARFRLERALSADDARSALAAGLELARLSAVRRRSGERAR